MSDDLWFLINVFIEIIKGRPFTFLSQEEIEVSWKIVDQISRSKPRIKTYNKNISVEKLVEVLKNG